MKKFSRSTLMEHGVLVFFLKVALLTFPAMILFTLLRSKPAVQTFVSEHFPVYHLAKVIMLSAQKVLLIMGYPSRFVYDMTIYHYGVFSLQINNGTRTFIGFSCLGIGVSWVFVSFIIAMSGRMITKSIYILSGILLIFILNVLRMSYLTWLGRDGSNFTEKTISIIGLIKMDHHAIFNLFIYIVTFALIVLWVEVFSKK